MVAGQVTMKAESGAVRRALLRQHKVELPDPIEGYVHRPELEARCALTAPRLTVLALLGKGPRSALAVVDRASEYARRTNRVSLARFLSALRVSVLVAGGESITGVLPRYRGLSDRADPCVRPPLRNRRSTSLAGGGAAPSPPIQ